MFLCLFNSNVANAKSIYEARAIEEAYTDNDSAKLRKLCSYNKKMPALINGNTDIEAFYADC